jgi:2-polyprenyl-3-methyl-5-hydroxy-6-metoxy-1,4-benzoquinol methylase
MSLYSRAVITDPEGADARRARGRGGPTWKRMLEVGSGDGRLTWRSAELTANVLGVDPDAEWVATARADTPNRCATAFVLRRST